IFFFQAEDGIRDRNVTGVQTCALPILHLIILIIYMIRRYMVTNGLQLKYLYFFNFYKILMIYSIILLYLSTKTFSPISTSFLEEIGRASCRERVYIMCVVRSIVENIIE